MKPILFLVSLFITINIFAQRSIVGKLWAGTDNYYFQADTAIIRFETFTNHLGNTRLGYKYFLKNDTLKIIDRDIKGQIFTSNLLIDTSYRGKLQLTPVNEHAHCLTTRITLTDANFFTKEATLAQPKKQLTFIETDQIYTDTIKFEKIIFNATNCYGFCPAISLLIDKSKQVQFIGGKYAIKEGMFRSEISDAQLFELKEILKTAALDKLVSNNETNLDAPTYTLEIYYNNKIRILRSCMLPFLTDKLVKYLLDLPKKIKLTESPEPIEIKF